MHIYNHKRKTEKYLCSHFNTYRQFPNFTYSKQNNIVNITSLQILKKTICPKVRKNQELLFLFSKYILYFYNYKSNCTSIYLLSNVNYCVCELFLILLMQNSADNANREIEAYTDLGLAFQKSAALQLEPDFKRSLILFSNKINSQIFKRFQHFGNLIIRSSC